MVRRSNNIILAEPRPIPDLQYRNVTQDGGRFLVGGMRNTDQLVILLPAAEASVPTCGSKATSVACSILGCPVKCPVCVCDFIGHSCGIFCDGLFHPAGDIDSSAHRQQTKPGCCTECASQCCPRICINPQSTSEERSQPRRALQLSELWCRATQKEGCCLWTSMALCVPCWLPAVIFIRCIV